MKKYINILLIVIFTFITILFKENSIYADIDIDKNRVIYYENNNIRNYAWFNDEDGFFYLFINENDLDNNRNIFYISNEIIENENDVKTKVIDDYSFAITDSCCGIINIKVCETNLDSVFIDLNGILLDDVYKDKDIKYENCNIEIISNSDKVLDSNIEFKGRGNSSWKLFEKRGFQIKFDKKTKVLGMNKAKKWILIPSASDGTLIKNKLMFDLAKKIGMKNTIDSHFIDLWINGDYMGVYLISEKVEIDDNRINDGSTLFEWDIAYASEEDYWFKYEPWENCQFSIKDSTYDLEENVYSLIEEFTKKLDYLNEFTNKPNDEIDYESLNEVINVDSFAKYYLLGEYSWNADTTGSNFYWYIDENNRLDLGPIWDFDDCMNSYGDDTYKINFSFDNEIFKRLLSINCFNEYVTNTYNKNNNLFLNLSKELIDISNSICKSAKANFIKWNYFGKENPKRGKYKNSYNEEIEHLSNWLDNRYKSFKTRTYTHFVIEKDKNILKVAIDANPSCKYKLYIWSIENGQDDLQCYEMKELNNCLSCEVDINKFNNSGMLLIHLYCDNSYYDYYHYFLDSLNPKVSANYNKKDNTLEITLKNAENCKVVHFPVWSLENDQDDLKWYLAKKQSNGDWTCTVDVSNHKSIGIYAVHAYETSNGNEMLCHTSVMVEQNMLPKVSANYNKKDNTLEITLKNAENCKVVHFPVWSLENDQDDLKWYLAKKQSNGDWTCTVDVSNHKSIGIYAVHAYETSNGNEMLCHTSVMVEQNMLPKVSANYNKKDNTLEITLKNAVNRKVVNIPDRSLENHQDDLKWYLAKKQSNGDWTCTVDVSNHKSIGIYAVHAYETSNGNEMLCHTSVMVEQNH